MAVPTTGILTEMIEDLLDSDYLTDDQREMLESVFNEVLYGDPVDDVDIQLISELHAEFISEEFI